MFSKLTSFEVLLRSSSFHRHVFTFTRLHIYNWISKHFFVSLLIILFMNVTKSWYLLFSGTILIYIRLWLKTNMLNNVIYILYDAAK